MSSILCWNIWFGGRELTDGRAKQAALVERYRPDVTLLQECLGDAGEALAAATGQRIRQQSWDTAVVTSRPSRLIGTETYPYATAAVVDLDGIGETLVWSVHLWFDDYGPYETAKGGDQAAVDALPGEQRRLREINTVIAETRRILTEELPAETPVILAGDFNCPATLDWAQRDDRPSIAWRAVDAVLAEGFTDAFRAHFPDAAAVGGETWSPIEPDEPFDRIDFFFTRGLEVESVRLIGATLGRDAAGREEWFEDFGGRCEAVPNQAENDFGSDHQAILATVRRATLATYC